MKIKLESPFKEKFSHGYLVVNKEPRRNVILYNPGANRTTISYARYLMSVHLGYEIDSKLEVDHINNDKMDDRIENYQLLTPLENRRKSAKPPKFRSLTCATCKVWFSRRAHQVDTKLKNGQKNFYCSYECRDKSLRNYKSNSP